MKALFLTIITILVVAIGAQVYKNYAAPVVPYVQPQENNNQERPPLSFEGDVFPTELKTDPATGDKIFEGLGVKFRVPGEGFHVGIAQTTKQILVMTQEDYDSEQRKYEEKKRADYKPAKGINVPPELVISFEQNTDNLTWEEWLKEVGLYDSQRIIEHTANSNVGAYAIRFSGTVSGQEALYFLTPDNKYIVGISVLKDPYVPSPSSPLYLLALESIISSIEFIR